VNFDRWWDWDDDGGRPDHGGHLQKLPDGRHTGDIVNAESVRKDWFKTPTNPDGQGIKVTFSKQGYYDVDASVSVEWRGKIEAICRSAGVTPPRKGEEWDEKTLVGRTVTVEVAMQMSKGGNEYLKITKWHPGPAPLPPAAKPAKRAAARTPAAKAHEEFNANAPDDIPF
jgi:hypothetical protein